MFRKKIKIQLHRIVLFAVLGSLISPISGLFFAQEAKGVASNPAATCNATTCSVTFTTTSDYFTYVTPVANVSFTIKGGQGSAAGGIVTGTFANVPAGTSLTIYVGAAASGATGGLSGGRTSGGTGAPGASSYNGAGGGGHSEITWGSTPLAIAGGGGGTGGYAGAAGGTGGSVYVSATLYAGAAGGTGQGYGGAGGSSSGGAGGAGNGANGGSSGGYRYGGAGGYSSVINGGGGGGGYYGGGGGGADSNLCCADGGGGGGGSSYVNGSYISGTATFTSGNTGAGSVVISYPAAYTVTFDNNSGTGTPSVTSATQASAGASVTLATQNTLARSGFTFSGWNTAADGSGTNYAAGLSGYVPGSSLTLYAQWNSTITYDSNTATSGTAPPATTAKSSAAVTTLATNSGTLAKTNYTFGGWNLAANGTGSSYAAGATNYPSDGNRTIYARWDSVITYLANGGTGSTANSTLFGTSGNLSSSQGTLAKANFTFGGWNANETGTGTSYALGAAYTPSGNRSLYAQWNSVITYNGNNSGGTGSVPANTTISGLSGTLATNSGSLTMPSKVFAGWNTSSLGTGTWYAAGGTYPNTGNVTLYAQWVTALSFTGSSTINVGQGNAYRSDTYTATSGLDTKTVTYSLSPTNTGITLETSTVTGTTYAYIRVANTVASGTYVDTLTATDRMGTAVNKVVTITVSAPMRWSVSNGSSITTTYGKAASLRLDVTNGFSGKSFTLTQIVGNNSGITLDTSTAASSYVTLNVASTVPVGNYTESITATDSSGVKIYSSITITINGSITITRNGNTIASNLSSILFNGSSQYAYFPASNKFQIGSTYTIEWWQYQTDSNAYARIFSENNTGFQVSFESSNFYYWIGGTYYNLGPLGTYKNKWTHFAIVVNNLQAMAYRDGIALKNASTTVTAVNATAAPDTTPLCLATRCTGTTPTINLVSEMFGGNLTNFSIAKRVDYTGVNTASANFTPATSLTVDATTVVALAATGSSSVFTDVANNGTSLTYIGSPTGSSMSPGGVMNVVQEIATTQGTASALNTFAASSGTGSKTLTLTTSTVTATTSATTNQLTVTIDSSNTSTNSTTAKTVTETLTATDASGATLTVPVKLTVNPLISLAATSLTPSTSAGIATYDTVTASYGTGTITFSVSASPVVAGITYTTPSAGKYLITADKTVPQGTYYETVTATDSVGSQTTTLITLTVNPGLSLVSATGSTSLITTYSRSTSLRLNALNGAGTKTFTLTQMSGSSAGITLDVSTAASGYATLNISGSVLTGSYLESITVTDTAGGKYSLAISVTVNPGPTITYSGATSGAITLVTTAGASVTSNAFTGSSGTAPRTFTLSGLNSGISLDTTTANVAYLILGNTLASTSSSVARTYYETLTVTDSLSATSLRAVSVLVNPAIALSATSNSLTTTAGIAVTDTVTASYGSSTKSFRVSISPSVAGISFTNNNANVAVINVANTVAAGSYTITLVATDTVSASSQIAISLTVNGGPVLTGPTSVAITTGYAYNTSGYSVSNGTGAVSFSLTGTLSATYISLETITATTFRLKLTSSTPSGSGVAATYYETITATDSLGARSTYAVTITVNPVVTLSGTQTINTTFGTASTNVFDITGGTAPYYVFASSICAPYMKTDGSYTVVTFTGTGTCNWRIPQGVTSIDSLVVGGGGSGDRGVCSVYWGHGGGGGEVIKNSGTTVTPGTSYSVTVGAGGAASGQCVYTLGTGLGNPGGNSSFGAITARGGSASGNNSAVGGSSGNGNAGGTGTGTYPAGGGGGAGGAGTGLNGGPGVSDSISGASVMYGSGGAGKNDAGWGTAYDGGGLNAVPAPNRGGGGSDLSPYSTSTPGATGVVIIRYLTPTESEKTYITLQTGSYSSSPTKLQVNIPDSITAGTYTETVVVKDSVGASTTYTININVAKATPSVSLAIPGGGSSATYGSPVALTANASTSGKFNFQKSGVTISSCGTVSTSSGTSSCAWTPSDTSSATTNAVFTPTDTTNYNSATTSNLVLSVSQADTLTVTFTSQILTYSDLGTAVSRSYSLSGLASIDAVSSVSTAITGTANDATSVNVTGTATYGSAGTSTVTKAGTFSLSGTAITFSGSTKASYYKAIVYTPGTITVNRAGNSVSFNYGTANAVTYSPTGTETATPTYKGNGALNYSTASTTNCSLNASTGAMTTLQAGSCVVTLGVAESANYLAETTTASVVINKAPRTVSLTSSAVALKYAETATVTTAIDFDALDGVVSYSNGSSTGCTFDSSTNILTATSGTATCTLSGSITEGTNYQVATSSALTITLSKAPAPTVTLIAPADVDYSPSATSSSMQLPTFVVSGLKLNDTVSALSYMTVTYVATGTYPYNSTTVPTGANSYTVIPSDLALSTGDIANYQNPNYVAASWIINKIAQETLTVTTELQESITVPSDIQYSGGTTNGSVSMAVVPGGTASGCYFVGKNLRASSTGTCIIRITMAGNQNYLDKNSDDIALTIAAFTTVVNFDAPGNTVIIINSEVPITKDVDQCSSACVPTITGVSSTRINSGDLLVITGNDFAGATEVIFNRSFVVTTFQIDSNSQITVLVPSGLPVGTGTGSVSVKNAGKISFRFSGLDVTG